MFNVNPNPTFPSAVQIPSPEGEKTLNLIFKHRTRDELKDLLEKAAASNATDAQGLMDIVEGWTDVDMEFNEVNLSRVIQNYHQATRSIVNAYAVELSQAKLGN